MDTFAQFLLSEAMELPDMAKFARDFFSHRMDTATLKVYGDYLADLGPQYDTAADLFRQVGTTFRDPKLKRGPWGGKLVGMYLDLFGSYSGTRFNIDDSFSTSWVIRPVSNDWGRYIPEHTTIYRLSLTNGKWFIYNNDTDYRLAVVSSRYDPTTDPHTFGPSRFVRISDFAPLSVQKVPDDLITYTFIKIIEKQVRGGM